MHPATIIAAALEKCLGAYFLFLNDLERPYDPYADLSPLINTREPDVLGEKRALYQAAFKFLQLTQFSQRYQVRADIPAYGQLGQDRFRLQVPPVSFQNAMSLATITRGIVKTSSQTSATNFNVDWQIPRSREHTAGCPQERQRECHLFTGATGHRRYDNACVESILGYVLFEVGKTESDLPYSITVAFRGSQSSGTTKELLKNATFYRSGNPDWVTGVNASFVPFFTPILPSHLPSEDRALILDWLSKSTFARHSVLVHEGYRQAFFSCLPALRVIFTHLAIKYRDCPLHEFTIATGHSLGAALSQLFWFAARDPLFWQYITNGVLSCTQEQLDNLPNPIRAVSFASPALWGSGYAHFPKQNGLYTLAVEEDSVVNTSAYRSCYPKGSTYIVLPRSITYTDSPVAVRGWHQDALDPHEPIVLLESLCDVDCLTRAQSQMIDERGILDPKKNFVSSLTPDFVTELQRSIVDIFPPLLFRGREVRCHYWHIFSHWRRDLSWNAMRPHMTDAGDAFFNFYHLGLVNRIDIFEIAKRVADSFYSLPEFCSNSLVRNIWNFFNYLAHCPRDQRMDDVIPEIFTAIGSVLKYSCLPSQIRQATLEYLHLILFLLYFCQLKEVPHTVYASTTALHA